jgi:hypothetical protein
MKPVFFSARIYNNKLKEPEKGKTNVRENYFNHEDSIYFIDARKNLEQIRGDVNL